MDAEIEPDSRSRLTRAFVDERPSLIARLRSFGRSVEEAEDLAHEVYAEALEKLPGMGEIRSIGAWLNVLAKRRSIDLWRRAKMRRAKGETEVSGEIVAELIETVGLDPCDAFVRGALADAVDDAMRALPPEQREVLEAQVFGGQTFREIAERTGVGIDALTARKRYAIKKLARALRTWIER